MVSAHWESQPLTVGATTPVPLVYDFYGFPERYYRTRYAAPGAPELAASVAKLIRDVEPVAQAPERGLDHGAYVPLTVMYPDADIPVLQMSLPDLDPEHLFAVGRRLAPLRDEGVLVVGSGFLTHGLPYVREYMAGKAGAPAWSMDFDRWAAEALAAGDLDALFDFRPGPGMPYAHPTVEHLAPLFVTLGAAAVAGEARVRSSKWMSISAANRARHAVARITLRVMIANQNKTLISRTMLKPEACTLVALDGI